MVEFLQRTAGNQAVARLIARVPGPPTAMLQRMSYAIKHPTESAKSFNGIKEDAELHADQPLFTSAADFGAHDFAATPRAQKRKLHIFAHGNQEDVGGKAPAALADHLLDDCNMPRTVRQVTLHSCMSGAPDPRPGKLNKIYADQLHDALLARFHHAEVKGQKGLAFTDSEGRTRVLKEGKDEDEYKQARNAATTPQAKRVVEEQYLEKSTHRATHLQEALTSEDIEEVGNVEVALKEVRKDPADLERRHRMVEENARWRAEETEDALPEREEGESEAEYKARTEHLRKREGVHM
jgi:hypothetical protein